MQRVTSGIGAAVLLWVAGVFIAGFITYGLLVRYDAAEQFSTAWFLSGGVGVATGVVVTKLVHTVMRGRSQAFAESFLWSSVVLAILAVAGIAIIGTR